MMSRFYLWHTPAMAKPEIGYARTEDGLNIAYEFIEGCDPVLMSVPTLGLQIAVSGQIEAWREFRHALRRQTPGPAWTFVARGSLTRVRAG